MSGTPVRYTYALARALTIVRQGIVLTRAPHALRWRLETFGLYMPSLPESRPWWRVNPRAARALLWQLPGYTRWLDEARILSGQGARGWWRHRTGTDARAWEEWLERSSQ